MSNSNSNSTVMDAMMRWPNEWRALGGQGLRIWNVPKFVVYYIMEFMVRAVACMSHE